MPHHRSMVHLHSWNQFYGYREAGMKDEQNNEWWIGTDVEGVAQMEMERTLEMKELEKEREIAEHRKETELNKAKALLLEQKSLVMAYDSWPRRTRERR